MIPVAFANPGLAWLGLGLVAVPVLIHYFFRRRHRVVRWAAMEFLLAALKKQKRRVEIENLILLLLRCLAILLLGLAVARPAVDAAGLNPFGGGARAVVMIVDTSASMGAEHIGQSALERARARAGALLDDLPAESTITMMVTRDDTAGGAPRALLENATPDEARNGIAAIRLSHGPNRLPDVFRLAGDKLNRMRGRRLVVFVTDLQKRDWADNLTDLRGALATLARGEDEETDEPPPVTILDVGNDAVTNVTIEDFRIESGRQAFAGELMAMSVTLAHHGITQTAASGTLTLYTSRAADGQWEKVEAEDVLNLAAQRKHTTQFHHALPSDANGPARYKVVFEPKAGTTDRLGSDSERYLALRVRPPVRILPIRTYDRALDILKDADFLKVVEFLDTISPAELETRDLRNVDVLLWADAEADYLTAEGAARIADFVRRGGGLLAYLGEYARPGKINSAFFKDKGAGLFPMMLADGPIRNDEEHPVEIETDTEELQKRNPLFRETAAAYAFSPEITGYRRVTWSAPEIEKESVVARYDNGDPAVIWHRAERGRVIVVTTTPDERGWRLNGSTLPIVFLFNAAHWLVSSDEMETREVGTPITIDLPANTRELVIDPPEASGGLRTEPVVEEQTFFTLEATQFPGFYRVTARTGAPGAVGTKAADQIFDFAANMDPREGDLQRTNAAQLRNDLRDANLHFTSDVETILPRTSAGAGNEIGRTMLGGVIAVLFLELFLAWRFGRRRSAQ